MMNTQIIRTHFVVFMLVLFGSVALASEAGSLVHKRHSREDGLHLCIGAGVYGELQRGGINGRLWIDDIIGIDISGYLNWSGAGGAMTELMFKPPFPTMIRPYVMVGMGYHSYQIDTVWSNTDFRTTLGMSAIRMGLGAESRFGKNDHHGIGLEVGYNIASADYYHSYTLLGSADVIVDTVTYTIDPLSVQLAYTFYFEKAEAVDQDGDGRNDAVDNCPKIPEDIDGFQDGDGCPDYDNDGDGIADSLDQCPNNQEDFDNYRDEDGCPEPDNDEDGIVDSVDMCPNQPEVMNRYKDDDGCPDTLIKPQVKKQPQTKIILKNVSFDSWSSNIQESSYEELDKIIRSLKEWPHVTLEIQGHSDSIGQDIANMQLSKARADAVKTYLVRGGIDPSRLTTVGYGEHNPIASNSTEEGRALNRRVVLKRTDMKSQRSKKTAPKTEDSSQ